MSNRKTILLTAAALAAMLVANPAKAAPISHQAIDKYGSLCRTATRSVERRMGLPSGLLGAISLAESGRWDARRRESFAWPWTVTSGKESHYFPSRAAAVAEVRRLQAAGVSNIDVGCMQVNLHYHPDAFETLEQAFEPQVNATYAAGFLRSLRETHRSWHVAIQRYHSSDRARYVPYRRKVVNLWNDERLRIGREIRAERLAAYRARRAARF